MAGFLTSTDIGALTGQYYTGFLTFAINNIIVHKESKKSVSASNYNQRVIPGYNTSPVENTIQLIHESGVFPAIVKPNKLQKGNQLLELNTLSLKGQTLIKTTEAGGLYIKNGKTVNIEISGRDDKYTTSDEAIENFQGLKFYIFGLEKTN